MGLTVNRQRRQTVKKSNRQPSNSLKFNRQPSKSQRKQSENLAAMFLQIQLDIYIQLFREWLSEKSTKVYATRPKSSMGRSRELLHALNTNEM